MKKPALMLIVLAASTTLALSGCGGGGSSSSTPADLDGDGVVNALDAFPQDPAASVDADGDGFPDTFNANATPEQLAATILTLDAFPADPAIALDSDGDGFPDDFNVNATPAQKAACTKPLDRFPDDPGEHADEDDDGIGDNEAEALLASIGVIREAATVVMGSLKNVPIPEPTNLGLFLKSGEDANGDGYPDVTTAARAAAIQLGKALFWDMQVGSDGVACGSCHFNAGADTRPRNQLNPGIAAGDTLFGFGVGDTPTGWGPNYALTPDDFPFHQLKDPELEDFNARVVLFDTNDVASSQGVFKANFVEVVPGASNDSGTSVVDDVFHLDSANTRRVEPRNTPTMINAVFNFSNFWDGRAHPNFNGETVIGPLDAQAGVWVEDGGLLTKVAVTIPKSSLASQAVGPPLNTDEMSFVGRTFPDIGRKLLGLTPLGQQMVDPTDSVLGPLSNAPAKGINTTYENLIQAAFQPTYWGSAIKTDGYTQMEANFALFFGLALQMYQATLISDQTPFDLFMEGDDASLRPLALKGLKIFMNVGIDPDLPPEQQFPELFVGVSQGFCVGCHEGPELTSHSVALAGLTPIEIDEVPRLVNGLLLPNDPPVFTLQDEGVYNIGVRPFDEDPGRGGSVSVNGDTIPLSFTEQAIMRPDLRLPFATLPAGAPNRHSTAGTFKVPGLRNVELTGPYMHNGGMATLVQVMEFYDRHGDFSDVNIEVLDGPLAKVQLAEGDEEAVIAFLLALTDERVRFEKAPFDRPQLSIPAGDGRQGSAESFIELPAVGAGGRATPLKPFLNLDPFTEQTLP
jgi:cytochrome c peroxidase